MYKLIALDMDGTLLNEDKEISLRNKVAIKKAREKGVKVVISTGRPISGIKKYMEQLGMNKEDDYAIVFNGSRIQKAKTGEVIFNRSLKGRELKELHRLSEKLNLNIHAFDGETCITNRENYYSNMEAEWNGVDLKVVDFEDYDDEHEIVKAIMVEKPEILEKAEKLIPAEFYEKYTIVKSAPFFLEFIEKNSNKGEGVKALANHMGITMDNVICIGDAENDLHMIKYAGLGVAMGNAFEEVKKEADIITGTNQEDGVALVIEKFILKEEIA